MKSILAIKQRIAFGRCSRELDGGLDTLATRAGEKDPFQIAASKRAQTLGQFACQFRNVTLQHRRPPAIQFLLQGLNNPWMIMSRVVDTVTRQKIQIALPTFTEQFGSETALVANIHVEQVQQAHPLRIHELCVCGRSRNTGVGHEILRKANL